MGWLGLQVDGLRLRWLCFADDIVLRTAPPPSGRIMDEFEDACGKIGLQMNLTKSVHEQRMPLKYSIEAQSNEHIPSIQLYVLNLGIQHDNGFLQG